MVTALNHIVMFASEHGFRVPVPVRARGGNLMVREMLPISGSSSNGGEGVAVDEGGESL